MKKLVMFGALALSMLSLSAVADDAKPVRATTRESVVGARKAKFLASSATASTPSPFTWATTASSVIDSRSLGSRTRLSSRTRIAR